MNAANWFFPAVKKVCQLASQAKAICRPNPAVGAVVIRNGKIIGQGHTQEIGKAHAEVMAIKSAPSHLVAGSDLMVSLTPCCFQGRTGPCTDLIIQSKVKSVIILLKDPHPKVINNSENFLKQAKINVFYIDQFVASSSPDKILHTHSKLLEKIWDLFVLNLDYYKMQILKQPLITLKYAMSLDGKMANHQGESKWITNEISRQQVQRERSQHDAVMVGARTFFKDFPRLNVRAFEKVKQPLPIVVIDQAESEEIKTIDKHPLWKQTQPVLFLIHQHLPELKKLEKKSEETSNQIKIFPDKNGNHWNTSNYLSNLAKEIHLNSFYVEGGASLHGKLMIKNSQLVDRLSVYLAPVLFLGSSSTGSHPFNDHNKKITAHFPPHPLWKIKTKKLGTDVWISGFYQKEKIIKIWEKVFSQLDEDEKIFKDINNL